MSEHGSFPPPGGPPPGPPPPGGPTGPPGPWGPGGAQDQPAWRPPGAAHRPGAIALRPLRLGDFFDGAFRIIRFNPRATIVPALVIALVAMALPIAVSSLLGLGLGGTVDPRLLEDSSGGEAVLDGLLASFGSLVVGSVLLQLGLLLLTGMIAHVTHAAASGRRITLAESWAATHGKRWRLVGLALLLLVVFTLVAGVWTVSIVAMVLADLAVGIVVLYAVLSGLVLLVVAAFFYVRVTFLAVPALMLEDVGVFGAFARSWRLSASQFWRLVGISLLTGLVASIAGSILGVPFSLAGQGIGLARPELAVVGLVIGQALSTVVSATFTAPFSAAVSALLYLDQRIRKEAYDVDLMVAAGITEA